MRSTILKFFLFVGLAPLIVALGVVLVCVAVSK